MIRLAWYSEDPQLQPLFASTLGADYAVVVESERAKLKAMVAEGRVDVLILDFDCRHSTRDEQLSFFEEVAGSGVPVVVMTDDDSRAIAMELLDRGAYDFFRKPPAVVELRVVVRRAYEQAMLKRELERARSSLKMAFGCDRLVGLSAPAQRVYEMIRKVADLNAFVLIRGQSGTGKELVAKAIHKLSHRSQLPFVAVPCGAIPEALIEAELFGHEKGAYTGTTGARAGYLEQAGAGTLFLDEIGELSLATQVKLLRVLQQKEFSRLGSTKLVALKARVLFATHRNLAQMVEQQTFRRDLYFRVNVMEIRTPSLQERTEDIPLLAKHFLRQYSESFGKPVREISPAALSMLVDYHWPGNVRELENAIQSAVVMAEGARIGPQDLPLHIREAIAEAGPRLVVGNSFEDRVREYKLQLAYEALEECNGNRTLAAQRLNISRSYLHLLIRREPEELQTVPKSCAG